MTEAPVELTIAFTDPELSDEEREADAQLLRGQLADWEDVKADRVLDPHPPAGNKALGSFLFGLLTLEVSKANFQKLAAFLGQRLGNKPIKFKVKTPDGRELEVEASSKEELDYAIKKAQDFIKNP
jgi:hypothetical protein